MVLPAASGIPRQRFLFTFLVGYISADDRKNRQPDSLSQYARHLVECEQGQRVCLPLFRLERRHTFSFHLPTR